MTNRSARHYLDWAGPVRDAVAGQVGFLDAEILHLWHGDARNRQYHERYQTLSEFDFDPFVDIGPDAAGCWRWSSNKPEMHAWVRSYFDFRREDG
jgi:hypothetical protein